MKRSIVVALACSIACVPARARAQGMLGEAAEIPAPPPPLVSLQSAPQRSTALTLEEVLGNVKARFPLLQAEQQRANAASGDELSARGSFDPKWKTKGTFIPVGYYKYAIVDSTIEQPLYYGGASIFANYNIGQGKFPLYYDGYRTNSLGEVRLGVSLPILRGSTIDPERAKLWKAEAGVTVARQEVVETLLELQQKAAYKYWEWVAAAKKLVLAKELLVRAVDRQAGITTRVTRGDAPETERVDNARTIVQREQQVVSAERALTGARLGLSLFVRDESGNPVIPSPERVPTSFPEPVAIDGPTLERDLARASSLRPEIRKYEAKRRQYEVERDLARNDAWPALNVVVAGAKQFGDGYPQYQPAQLEAGVVLDIPLRTRKQDGRADAANAHRIAYELELRYARDKIAVEVRDAAAGADAAAQRLQLTRNEVQLARQLEQAERRRFEMGDSTILFVNIREQNSFEAATRELDTLLEHQKALSSYRAVIGRS